MASVEALRRVGVGLVGCGDVALLHAAALRACENARLVGLWNVREEDVTASGVAFEVRERALQLGCSKAYGTLEELLADPAVEAVYVLTPLESHYALARRALEAGKHVLVEKPAGASRSEVEGLAAIASERGLWCVPGHNYVYDPQLEDIRSLVVQGQLGRLAHLAVFYNIRHGPDVTTRLAEIVDQILTHHAYTTLFLTGDVPTDVSCMTANVANGAVERSNVAVAMLRMRSGAICILQASFAGDDHSAEPWSFYIKALGSEGSARYSYNDAVRASSHTIHSHTYMAFPRTVDRQTAHFIRECVLAGRSPLSSLADAAMCIDILAACKLSAAERRHVSLQGGRCTGNL